MGWGWFWPRSNARRPQQGCTAPTAEARSGSSGPGALRRGTDVDTQIACRGAQHGQQQRYRSTFHNRLFARCIQRDHAGVLRAMAVTLPPSVEMRRWLGMRVRRCSGFSMGMFLTLGMRPCVLARLGLRPHLSPPPAQRLVQQRGAGQRAGCCGCCGSFVHVQRTHRLPLRNAKAQTWQQRDQAPCQPTFRLLSRAVDHALGVPVCKASVSQPTPTKPDWMQPWLRYGPRRDSGQQAWSHNQK